MGAILAEKYYTYLSKKSAKNVSGHLSKGRIPHLIKPKWVTEISIENMRPKAAIDSQKTLLHQWIAVRLLGLHAKMPPDHRAGERLDVEDDLAVLEDAD